MSAQSFLDTVKSRRSYYALKSESPIDNKKILDIVEQSLLQVPSSFNSQSNRVIVLFAAEHEKFWELVKEVLKAIVPGEAFATSEKKINGFKAGYGTVLFFQDRSVVSSFQEKFALYADKFPGWAEQSVGMLQFAIWTALEAEGLGANLQHYNPIVDRKFHATWDVPTNWELNAQLVFGTPTADPYPKDFKDLKETMKVYGA